MFVCDIVVLLKNQVTLFLKYFAIVLNTKKAALCKSSFCLFLDGKSLSCQSMVAVRSLYCVGL